MTTEFQMKATKLNELKSIQEEVWWERISQALAL